MDYWMRFLQPRLYREGDPDADGGGGGTPKKKTTKKLKVELPPEVLESFKNAADRADSMEQFAQQLFDENHTLREEKRELQQKVDAGTGGMSEKDKTELAAFRELGTLDEVKALRTDAVKLKKEAEKRELKDKAEKAAVILEYNPQVFAMLVQNEKLELIIKNVKVSDDSDDTVAKVFYKAEGQDDAGNATTVHTPIEDYIKTEHPDLLPSLEAVPTNGARQSNERPGHLFPEQRVNRERSRTENTTKGAGTSVMARKYIPKDKAS